MSKNMQINRRNFLRKVSLTGAGIYLAGCVSKEDEILPTPFSTPAPFTPEALKETTGDPTVAPSETPSYGDVYLSIVHGEDPTEMVRRAIAAIGGIEQFVFSGADVIVKPNICTDYYSYEYGATTNPFVVAALVSMSLGAGARRVRVMDNPFGGTAQSAYNRSGIEEVVVQAGGSDGGNEPQ